MINKKILLLICLYTFSVVCDASWRNEHERGWHWYERKEGENKKSTGSHKLQKLLSFSSLPHAQTNETKQIKN